jgi:hypothetical protein
VVDLTSKPARATNGAIADFIGLLADQTMQQASPDLLQSAAKDGWAGVVLQDCGEPVCAQ